MHETLDNLPLGTMILPKRGSKGNYAIIVDCSDVNFYKLVIVHTDTNKLEHREVTKSTLEIWKDDFNHRIIS